MFTAAVVTFASMMLLVSHLSPKFLRRLVGYKGYFDIVLHTTILYMFFGTSTEGLLQAECAGIFFSLWLRAYRWLFGFEKLIRDPKVFGGTKWVRFSGYLSRD